MKRIHPEDPRVTAHALGELAAHEAAEIERAAATMPEIRNALEETHALASLIRAGFRTESHELGEARREAIRRAGRQPVVENLVSMRTRPRWGRPAVVTTAAAALVVGAVWMIQQVPVGDGRMTEAEREQSQRAELRTQMLLAVAPRPRLIGPGPAPSVPAQAHDSPYQAGDQLSPEAVSEEHQAMREFLRRDPAGFEARVAETARGAGLASLAKLPALADNPFLPAREFPSTTVPLVSGRAGYPLVDRFVRTEGKLPPKNAVRVEELINHVLYEGTGDADLDGVRLRAELVRCPWEPRAVLLGILLHNGSDQTISRDALLRLDVRPSRILSYRLLGYAGLPDEDRPESPVPQSLAPGKSNLVLYQLQALQLDIFEQHRVVADVALRLGNGDTRGLLVPVASPPRDWDNASNNLQTAIALGGWGMLLRESPYRGTLTPALLEELAGSAQTGVEDGDLARREALQLVLDSMPLLRGTN